MNSIQPLCDKHRKEMRAVIVELTLRGRHTISELGFPAFRCSDADCTRHYEQWEGYIDVIPDGLLLDKYGRPFVCPKHENALYIAAYQPQTDVETWRCPEPGCEHQLQARA